MHLIYCLTADAVEQPSYFPSFAYFDGYFPIFARQQFLDPGRYPPILPERSVAGRVHAHFDRVDFAQHTAHSPARRHEKSDQASKTHTHGAKTHFNFPLVLDLG